MAAVLDHLIVPSRDRKAAARPLADDPPGAVPAAGPGG
jgi:hypothetical protein